jgi:hypothetical protein
LFGGQSSGAVVFQWNPWSTWRNAVQIAPKSAFIETYGLCQRNPSMGSKIITGNWSHKPQMSLIFETSWWKSVTLSSTFQQSQIPSKLKTRKNN